MVMSLLRCAGLGEGALQGVVASGDLAVSQHAGTPGMNVDIAAGRAFVQGTQTNFQGSYHVSNDAVKTLTIAASNPSNPRIDIVVATVRDHQYPVYSQNDWLLQVITGTAASSPVPPSTPTDSIVLAQVAVAANAMSVVNANITDERTRAGTTRYHASAHGTTAQNDSNGVNAILVLNVEDYDPSNSFNPSTYTFTAPATGLYFISASYALGCWSTDQGDRGLFLYKNGSSYRDLDRQTNQTGTTGGNQRITGMTSVLCTVGDTLQIYYVAAGTIANNIGGQWADFLFLGPQ